MINWPGKICVALLNRLPISSTAERFQVTCKIMVCNYTETKKCWRHTPCIKHLFWTQFRSRGTVFARRSRFTGQSSHVHMHVQLQVQPRDVSTHCSLFCERRRCAARGSYMQCNDCTPPFTSLSSPSRGVPFRTTERSAPLCLRVSGTTLQKCTEQATAKTNA